MCLILTFVAALISGSVFLYRKNHGGSSKALFTLFCMYFAASLMWTVDSVASVAGGDEFFDISAKDAILGVLIVCLGLLSYGFLRLKDSGNSRNCNF